METEEKNKLATKQHSSVKAAARQSTCYQFGVMVITLQTLMNEI